MIANVIHMPAVMDLHLETAFNALKTLHVSSVNVDVKNIGLAVTA